MTNKIATPPLFSVRILGFQEVSKLVHRCCQVIDIQQRHNYVPLKIQSHKEPGPSSVVLNSYYLTI